jgi:hypothetical protein
MIKTLAGFTLLNLLLLKISVLASPVDSGNLRDFVAGKQIYGKGLHNQCLPYALGLAQVLHDRFNVGSVGIVYTWAVAGFPTITGRHIAIAYTTTESGGAKHWITDNETRFPILVTGENPAAWISALNYRGSFSIDRILALPLTSISDREYIGGALMAGTLSR